MRIRTNWSGDASWVKVVLIPAGPPDEPPPDEQRDSSSIFCWLFIWRLPTTVHMTSCLCRTTKPELYGNLECVYNVDFHLCNVHCFFMPKSLKEKNVNYKDIFNTYHFDIIRDTARLYLTNKWNIFYFNQL